MERVPSKDPTERREKCRTGSRRDPAPFQRETPGLGRRANRPPKPRGMLIRAAVGAKLSGIHSGLMVADRKHYCLVYYRKPLFSNSLRIIVARLLRITAKPWHNGCKGGYLRHFGSCLGQKDTPTTWVGVRLACPGRGICFAPTSNARRASFLALQINNSTLRVGQDMTSLRLEMGCL